MPLRIAHVTATFPPYRGGTGNVCYHNARELARRGHAVHVCTAALDGAAAQEMREGMTIQRLRSLVQIGNAPVLPGLVQVLKGFDIIHLHYPFILGAEMVRAASLLYGTPLLVSFHNDLIGNGPRAPLFSIYQNISARLTVRGAARLCAVSLDHYQSSRLRRALTVQRPCAVEVPNGVDTALFAPSGPTVDLETRYGVPVEARIVLFIAALDRAHHFKGLNWLLQACQLLPPDVWLMVIGDGDLRQVYQQQATSLGVADRTVFVGAIDHAHTPAFFRRADVTVLPSAPPESFGLVLIESLACGTPVIASNIPGVRTVVDHGSDGLLVDPGDSTALGTTIVHLLGDEVGRREMGRRGRARVEERYGWPRIGAQLEKLYTQVLEDKKVPVRFSIRGER